MTAALKGQCLTEHGPGDGWPITCHRCGDDYQLAELVEHIEIARPPLEPTR